MKGTFLSFDFVKNNDGDLKFLEMNTDTTANQRALDSMDFTSLLNVISILHTTRNLTGNMLQKTQPQ